MKKIFLFLLFILIIPISVYAKSGCCSSHGGVDCSRKQSNGKVICNDGWTGSSCYYSEMKKCEGYIEETKEEHKNNYYNSNNNSDQSNSGSNNSYNSTNDTNKYNNDYEYEYDYYDDEDYSNKYYDYNYGNNNYYVEEPEIKEESNDVLGMLILMLCASPYVIWICIKINDLTPNKSTYIEKEKRIIETSNYKSYTLEELILLFEGLIEEELIVTIKYKNHFGEIVEDKINPERIFIKNLVHYVEAYSCEDDERIIINMSNIIGIKKKK